MKLFTTVLASACMAGMLGGAAVSARADNWDHHDPGWHGDHRDAHADRDWRWHHPHPYVAPSPRVYGYYAPPPPVYYAPPAGVTVGVTVP